jgi:hypothetical protein
MVTRIWTDTVRLARMMAEVSNMTMADWIAHAVEEQAKRELPNAIDTFNATLEKLTRKTE